MRYLKRFNESPVDFKEGLKDFCETHLAYLLDNEFIIEINEFNDRDGDDAYEIIIKKNKISAPDSYSRLRQPLFVWDDVKNYIGPFILYLDREYRLFKGNEGDVGIVQSELSSLFKSFSVDEISDENYDPKLIPSNASNTKLEFILIYSVFQN